MPDPIDYERPISGEVPDETDVNLRAYLAGLPDEHLKRYDPSWNDEQVMDWDGNFRSDGALMLVCCERDVDVAEFRRVLEEHMTLRSGAGRVLKSAFVTGGHPFDVLALHGCLRSIAAVDFYPQHMEDWASAGARRGDYDVVVFYHMLREVPPEDGRWYERGVRAALEELGATPQGIVVLHHAILAYPELPMWSELVGMRDRSFGYHHDQRLTIHVETQEHPITAGLSDWEMGDETYTMADPGPDSTVLLTTDHSPSMRVLAWTRQYRESRVFCYQAGHDAEAFNHPMFRTVLARGVLWAAGRL